MAPRRQAKQTTNVGDAAPAARPRRKKMEAAVTAPAEESKSIKTKLRKPKTDKEALADNTSSPRKTRTQSKSEKVTEPESRSVKSVNRKKVAKKKAGTNKTATTVEVKETVTKEPTAVPKSKVRKPATTIKDNVADETEKIESTAVPKSKVRKPATTIKDNVADETKQIESTTVPKSKVRKPATTIKDNVADETKKIESTAVPKSKVRKPVTTINDNIADETKKIESKKKNETKEAHATVIENKSDTKPQSADKTAENVSEIVFKIPDEVSCDNVNKKKTRANDIVGVVTHREAGKFPAKKEVLTSPLEDTTRKERNNQTVASKENNLKISAKDSKKTANTQNETTKKAVTRKKRNAIIEETNDTQEEIGKTNAAIGERQIKRIIQKKEIIKTAVLEASISNINNIKNVFPSIDNNPHKEQKDDCANCFQFPISNEIRSLLDNCSSINVAINILRQIGFGDIREINRVMDILRQLGVFPEGTGKTSAAIENMQMKEIPETTAAENNIIKQEILDPTYENAEN